MYQELAKVIDLFEIGLNSCHRPEDRRLVERYQAELGRILAAAVLGRNVLGEIAVVERLFGQTWLVEFGPFEAAFEKWAQFKRAYEEYSVRGMTVNERLFAFSKIEEYDKAESSKNIDSIRTILRSVFVDEPSIEIIVDRVKGGSGGPV